MTRKEHSTLSDAMLWGAAMFILWVTMLAGESDHEEAQRQAAECQAMRLLWEKTDGGQGWPHCGN